MSAAAKPCAFSASASAGRSNSGSGRAGAGGGGRNWESGGAGGGFFRWYARWEEKSMLAKPRRRVKTRAAPQRPASAKALLGWYDRHARRLPWRALPGETPDPYRVWLS